MGLPHPPRVPPCAFFPSPPLSFSLVNVLVSRFYTTFSPLSTFFSTADPQVGLSSDFLFLHTPFCFFLRVLSSPYPIWDTGRFFLFSSSVSFGNAHVQPTAPPWALFLRFRAVQKEDWVFPHDYVTFWFFYHKVFIALCIPCPPRPQVLPGCEVGFSRIPKTAETR